MSKEILNKIKLYCQSAIDDANDALEEDLTDGSEDIYEGRFELAQSLLERIEIWEKENGNV